MSFKKSYLLSSISIFSILAFLLPVLLYFFSLPTGITWAYHSIDGGDLITAAYTLGVPHPSGYPGYVLVGWLFSKIPIGTIAWRFNLLSAISMAGGSWLLFKSILFITKSELSGLVAAWTFAFTPLVWSQAIVSEVYALNLFFVTLFVWLGLQIASGHSNLAFYLGLSFGFALSTHLTSVFLLPLLVWFGYKGKYSYRQILFTGIGLLMGLSVFIYLPLRAGQGAITWGTPHTWQGFLALVSGQMYQGYLFALPLERLIPRGWVLLNYFTQPGVFVVALAIIGLRWGWYYAKISLLVTFGCASTYIVYALGYNTIDSYVYLIPVFAFFSISVGLGTKDILDVVADKPYQVLIKGGLLIIPLVLAGINGPKLSLHTATLAENFWQEIVNKAPPQAVLLTFADEHTFTLWYAHYVLALRPDIVIVDTRLVAYPWHKTDLQRTYPTLSNVDTLANIYQKKGTYHRPLCAIIPDESNNTWSLDCFK